jgi:hypothetical protein
LNLSLYLAISIILTLVLVIDMALFTALIIGIRVFIACIGAGKLTEHIIKSGNPYLDLD